MGKYLVSGVGNENVNKFTRRRSQQLVGSPTVKGEADADGRALEWWRGEKVVGLTGFVIIYVFIASFSPVQGERNQVVNTKFTRPVNEMPMSSPG